MRRPWPNPSFNEHTQSTQRQTGHLDEQFTLLAAQSACVQERRRTLRERQRSQLALALLVIPGPHFEKEVEEGCCLSSGSTEEPRSRFSHSSPPSPVAMNSPLLPVPLPAPPAVPRKRKSILAKLMKAFVL